MNEKREQGKVISNLNLAIPKDDLKKRKFKSAFKKLVELVPFIQDFSLKFKITFYRLILRSLVKLVKNSLINKDLLDAPTYLVLFEQGLAFLQANQTLIFRQIAKVKKLSLEPFPQYQESFIDESKDGQVRISFELNQFYCNLLEFYTYFGVAFKRTDPPRPELSFSLFNNSVFVARTIYTVCQNSTLANRCALTFAHLAQHFNEEGSHDQSLKLINQALDVCQIEQILLERKLRLSPKQGRRVRYKMSKGSRLIFALLVMKMINYQNKQQVVRLFQVGHLTKWFSNYYMPKDDLSKNFQKVFSDITNKYEHLLNTENQLNFLLHALFHRHHETIETSFAKLRFHELALQQNRQVDVFNKFAYDKYGHKQINQAHFQAILRKEEQKPKGAHPKQQTKYVIEQQTQNHILKVQSHEVSRNEGISIDDIIYEEAFDLSFEFELNEKTDKAAVPLVRKVEDHPLLSENKTFGKKRRSTTLLREMRMSLQQQGRSGQESLSNYLQNIKFIKKQKKMDEKLTSMDKSIIINRRKTLHDSTAIVKQSYIQLEKQLKNQAEKIYNFECSRQYAKSLLKTWSSIQPYSKYSIIKIANQVHSEKLRHIIFKHTKFFGIQKLKNFRLKLQEDRKTPLTNQRRIQLQQFLNVPVKFRKQAQTGKSMSLITRTLSVVNVKAQKQIKQQGYTIERQLKKLKKRRKL